ncbi:TldD/PmbA family protein [Neomegalonema perideroedes]|uniref:TldD/PmbA family protein n=1 Tax=Neomegalonema perideroedes TaxID=217219 RepID=UPI00037612F8|nr:metallopeptidase TldD-related protein [Neomegalonema perideroedes]
MTSPASSSSVSSAPFAPFGAQLDSEAARRILSEALKGADDGELYLERRRIEHLSFDDGRLAEAQADSAQGFGLRVVAGETVGYAHSPELTEAALRRAAAAASEAATAGRQANLALSPERAERPSLYEARNPLDGGSLGAKAALLREIDAYVRARDPRVKQVSASLGGGLTEVEILHADGKRVSDSRPSVRLMVSVIVESNARRESGYALLGGRHGFERLISPEGWRHVADEALRRALLNLEAEEAPAGQMEVALASGGPGVLLHEAVGHGLEGDFNRKGTSAFSKLMGEQVAAKGVTVVDDGTIPEARGSLNVDDEGEPTARNVLIEDGRLVGYMQDRQNARLMGAKPTGNGRRQSYAHMPMPRMTNTFALAGPHDPQEIVKAVKDGIYAVEFSGGQVDITSGKFVFNCVEAYRVKNGEILHPVKGATIIGDGPTALKQIRMVGNDVKLDDGGGTCGKNGQGVPVTCGQPSLLIDGLVVGGRGER